MALDAGAEFSDWAEFLAALAAFQEANHVELSIVTSKTVLNENRKLPDSVDKFPEEHVYRAAKFGCIHHGKPRSRSTGIRGNQSSFRMGCPAEIYVSSDRKKGKLVIKTFNNNHNHEVNEDVRKFYPSQRRLDGDLLEEARKLTRLKVDVKRLKDHIHSSSGKLTTLKDLHNLRTSLDPKETEGEAVLRALQDFLNSDKGAKVAVVQKPDKTLDALYIQTSAMASSFQKFPEVIFMDSTYKTNNLNMPLFTITVMDGDGVGQPVGYVILTDETKSSIVTALQLFLQHNPQSAAVRTVIIDKDPSEIAAVSEVLPHADVIICLFHTMKALKEAARQHVKDREVHEEVTKLIKKLAYSLTEESYDEAFGELVSLEGAEGFAGYYTRQWHNIRTQWVKCFTDRYTNYGNRTNNRVESSHDKLKKLLRGKVTLSKLVRNLVLFSSTKASQSSVRGFNEQMKVPTGRTCPIENAYMMEYTTYAGKVICQQLSLARLGKYKVKREEDGSFSVGIHERSYKVNNTCTQCSCHFLQKMGMPCRHLFAARIEAAFELFDMSLVAERWKKDTKAHAENAELETQSQNIITCETIPSKRAKSAASKYTETMQVCKEIANVNSLCGQKAYDNRIKQLRYMLECYKSNKTVTCICAEDDNIGISEDEESQEDEDRPVEAGNLRPVTSHQDDTDVTDSEDEESHEDEDSPVEADNLRPVTSHQDDTDVTDSEDEESHEDEDSPVEADNLHQVSTTTNEDNNNSEDKGSQEGEGSPMAADNPRQVSTSTNEDNSNSEDKGSQEGEGSPIAAGNLRQVSTSTNEDNSNSEDKGSQEGEGSPIAAGNPRQVSTTTNEDNNNSEDKGSQEGEGSPMAADNPRQVSTSTNEDNSNSEDKGSQEGEGSPIAAGNLRQVSTSTNEDNSNSEDKGSQEGEGSPIAAGNLRQVSTSTNEDNSNSEDKGSQEGEGSPIAAGNLRQVSTTTNEDNNNSEDKGSQEGEGSPIAADNLRQVSTSTNEDNSNSEDKGSQEGEGSPIAADNPRQVSTSTNEDNSNSEDKGSQEGEGSPIAAGNLRQVSTTPDEDNTNSHVGQDKKTQFAACTVSFRHLPPLLKLPPKVQVRGRPKDCKKSVNKRFKVEKPSTRKQQRGKKRYTEENTDHSESEEPLRKKPKDDTVKQALAEAMNLMKDMPKGKLVVGNVSLNTSDMKRLLPGQWLHDKLVTAFLDLLGKLYPGQVLSLPPQLAQVWDSHKPRYSAWLYEKICFASYKFVLLPVCHHDHWMLLVANVADRTVAIVNSSRSFDKYMSQFQLKWQHYMTRRSRDVEPQLSSWTNTTLPSSRQHDGNSCGVFVLMNAESIARGRELKCMGHKDVPSFQKHVIYQLLANSEQDGNCAMLENCTFPLATSWILCGHCHQWLHLECAGFSKKPRGTYVCDACSERIAACQCVSHARV
ncbi:uncharacterized protein LOC118410003 isoform X2 [Branchiostoma floridae]|uniref:Uncharacterized protein LOC118410003 isoform X2 n=1 Tax=Branchiostoma floridae TaxID=7739 RepID=A0A9J7MHM5_BRAFL|nr:uncharacterized protein LOC118410003 isoform X2 [Branchiostoma floridae]